MRRFLARLATGIALILIAVVAALLALGYFAFALYLWLAVYLIPPVAAVVSGLIVLSVALMLVLIARAMLGGGGRRDRDARELSAAQAAAEIGNLFGDKVQGFADMNRGTSLLTALIAGFAVGVSPKLRALLWRIFKNLT